MVLEGLSAGGFHRKFHLPRLGMINAEPIASSLSSSSVMSNSGRSAICILSFTVQSSRFAASLMALAMSAFWSILSPPPSIAFRNRVAGRILVEPSFKLLIHFANSGCCLALNMDKM